MVNKALHPLIFFLLCIILMFAANKGLPGFGIISGKVGFAIGTLLICFGISLSLVSFKTLLKADAIKRPFQLPTKVVKEGPYGYCRNPVYLGMVLVLFGLFAILGSSTSLIVVLLFGGIVDEKFIRPEEKHFEKVFGKEYIEYKFKVSKWFPLLTDFAYEKTKK